jgi:hypothetical protein
MTALAGEDGLRYGPAQSGQFAADRSPRDGAGVICIDETMPERGSSGLMDSSSGPKSDFMSRTGRSKSAGDRLASSSTWRSAARRLDRRSLFGHGSAIASLHGSKNATGAGELKNWKDGRNAAVGCLHFIGCFVSNTLPRLVRGFSRPGRHGICSERIAKPFPRSLGLASRPHTSGVGALLSRLAPLRRGFFVAWSLGRALQISSSARMRSQGIVPR